jgi:hypothetical protein
MKTAGEPSSFNPILPVRRIPNFELVGFELVGGRGGGAAAGAPPRI